MLHVPCSFSDIDAARMLRGGDAWWPQHVDNRALTSYRIRMRDSGSAPRVYRVSGMPVEAI